MGEFATFWDFLPKLQKHYLAIWVLSHKLVNKKVIYHSFEKGAQGSPIKSMDFQFFNPDLKIIILKTRCFSARCISAILCQFNVAK